MLLCTITKTIPGEKYPEQSWVVIASDKEEAISMARDHIKEMEGDPNVELLVESWEVWGGKGVIDWTVEE